jgi:hypothetical protein
MSQNATQSKDSRDDRLRSIIARNRSRARGAVLVEYAFLLTAVAIPVMIGISAGGMQMLNNYRTARTSLMAPIP